MSPGGASRQAPGPGLPDTHDGLKVIAFASADRWWKWLERNHGKSSGVWIAIAKKGSGIDSVHYPEVLDHALCFGWIDGRRERLDEVRFLQRFTPRRARSRWSQVNRRRAEELIDDGVMHEAGLAEVERAREDGRWEAAYPPQTASAVPPDLQRELDASPLLAERFAALSAQNRYSILYRLQDARRPETRARRLAQFVAMLEAGDTPHPQ
jgi:uncharacterized protein YdeI (YjbR/CyaY-like superfamily)